MRLYRYMLGEWMGGGERVVDGGCDDDAGSLIPLILAQGEFTKLLRKQANFIWPRISVEDKW